MDMKGSKAKALIASNSDLLNSMFKDSDVTSNSYVTYGFNSFAVVNVDMSNIDISVKPKGFIYRDNDKIFICIDETLDIKLRNFAKAYLVGVFLLNKESIENGVFSNMFYYPILCDTSDTDELKQFVVRVLLPKVKFAEKVGEYKNIIRLGNIDLDVGKLISALSDNFSVTEELVKAQLEHIEDGIDISVNIASKTYDENMIKNTKKVLDDAIHTINDDTFESFEVRLDCVRSEDDMEDVDKEDKIENTKDWLSDEDNDFKVIVSSEEIEENEENEDSTESEVVTKSEFNSTTVHMVSENEESSSDEAIKEESESKEIESESQEEEDIKTVEDSEDWVVDDSVEETYDYIEFENMSKDTLRRALEEGVTFTVNGRDLKVSDITAETHTEEDGTVTTDLLGIDLNYVDSNISNIEVELENYMSEHNSQALGIVKREHKLQFYNNVDMKVDNTLHSTWSSDIDIVNDMTSCIKFLKSVSTLLKEYNQKLSEIDIHCNQILHSIEFTEDEEKRASYYKELYTTLQNRRIVKNTWLLLMEAAKIIDTPSFNVTIVQLEIVNKRLMRLNEKLLEKTNTKGLKDGDIS